MTTPRLEVCVLGSFMMDLTIRTDRRPRLGETVVGSSFEMFLGGKGFNQATAAARSGARTTMIGRVGDDDFGRKFLSRLARDGIDTTHVAVDTGVGTGVGAPVVDRAGDNSIIIVPRANAQITPADVARAADAIAMSRVLLLQLELPPEVSVDAARRAKAAGALVLLNPAPAAQGLHRFEGLVDVLTPNAREAQQLSGCNQPAEAAAWLQRRHQTNVIVTLGEGGALLADGDGISTYPTRVVTAVDTVAAGDVFCGALAARLAAGVRLRDAVTYANMAASIAVTRRGAEPSIPTRSEVQALLQERSPLLLHR